jgi:hypothetical protein
MNRELLYEGKMFLDKSFDTYHTIWVPDFALRIPLD